MKYLLVAHFAGFDMDDPEDLVNSSWLVGEALTETEAVDMAAKEINDYVEEQIESRFEDPDDIEDDEERAELEDNIENFRNEFEVEITNIRTTDKMETVATLYHDAEYYFEDLKIEVIKIGE